MNFEVNKIVGALLGATLATLGLGAFAGVLYAPAPMKKPGYLLPAGEDSGHGAHGATAAPAAAEPLPVLLAKADGKKGETLVKPCAACHSFDKGGAAKVGPPLYGVVGRPKGAIAGFAYSDAIKAKGGDWSFDALDQFIANPKGYVAGTKMAYAGEKEAAKRADMLAYLRSLSDSPAPLPK